MLEGPDDQSLGPLRFHDSVGGTATYPVPMASCYPVAGGIWWRVVQSARGAQSKENLQGQGVRGDGMDIGCICQLPYPLHLLTAAPSFGNCSSPTLCAINWVPITGSCPTSSQGGHMNQAWPIRVLP